MFTDRTPNETHDPHADAPALYGGKHPKNRPLTEDEFSYEMARRFKHRHDETGRISDFIGVRLKNPLEKAVYKVKKVVRKSKRGE
jgi:hypothetical protein